MTAYRVPLAVGLLVAVAFLYVINRYGPPDLFEAILGLVILYLAATNAWRLTDLAASAPLALQRLFTPAAGGSGGSGGRPPRAL